MRYHSEQPAIELLPQGFVSVYARRRMTEHIPGQEAEGARRGSDKMHTE